MYEKIILFVISFLFVSCASARYVSDNSGGTREYRETQSEIKTGETELAITSKDIEQSVNDIIETGELIEQSITESTDIESEIGKIIQRIRERKIGNINEYSEKK